MAKDEEKDFSGLAEGAVPPEDRRDAEPNSMVRETNEWIKSGDSGGGGPVFTMGGIMPGGTEFESWKNDPEGKLPPGSPTRPIGAPDNSPPVVPTGSTEPTTAETEHKQRG